MLSSIFDDQEMVISFNQASATRRKKKFAEQSRESSTSNEHER